MLIRIQEPSVPSVEMREITVHGASRARNVKRAVVVIKIDDRKGKPPPGHSDDMIGTAIKLKDGRTEAESEPAKFFK